MVRMVMANNKGAGVLEGADLASYGQGKPWVA